MEFKTPFLIPNVPMLQAIVTCLLAQMADQDQEDFKGLMDEVQVFKGRALSADEIAETYRMGANHRISRTITANDLSTSNTLPFYIAADRPGTYLEAAIGEGPAANYETDANTVLFLHGDEIPGSTSIKDSSLSGKAVTATNDAKISGVGKIGNSVYFDGTGDGVRVDGNADFVFAADFTIDTWIRTTSTANMHFYGTTNESAWTTDAWHIGYFNSSLVFGVFTNVNTQTFHPGLFMMETGIT